MMYEDEDEEIDEILYQNLEDFENQREVLSDLMGAMGKDGLISKDDNTSREMMQTPAPEREDYELLLAQIRGELEKIGFFEDMKKAWGELGH